MISETNVRIENFSLPATNSKATGQPLEKAAAEAQDTAAGLPTDAVQLSRLAQALSEDSDRSARIEQLRQQVAAGSYQPPASEVSKRIVDFHLQKNTDKSVCATP
jgi:flagellar biosynthesis anti-sigma factor FlgM